MAGDGHDIERALQDITRADMARRVSQAKSSLRKAWLQREGVVSVTRS